MYSLCVAYPEPLADKLYNETKEFLESHVKNIMINQVDIEMDSKIDDNNDTLLQRYFAAWSEYSQGINFLNYLYLYASSLSFVKSIILRL